MAQEIKILSPEETPGRGGKIGGKIASSSSVSASAVAKILSGIKFPKNKQQLVEYAEQNKNRVFNSDILVLTLKELNETRFGNLADVEKALGEIR